MNRCDVIFSSFYGSKLLKEGGKAYRLQAGEHLLVKACSYSDIVDGGAGGQLSLAWVHWQQRSQGSPKTRTSYEGLNQSEARYCIGSGVDFANDPGYDVHAKENNKMQRRAVKDNAFTLR